MATTNLLGPSMRQKEANKNIIDWSIVTVGSGLAFSHKRGMPGTTAVADAQNVPWGDMLEDVVELTINPSEIVALVDVSITDDLAAAVAEAEAYADTLVSGYTGEIVISGSVTLTVVNGLITTYA